MESEDDIEDLDRRLSKVKILLNQISDENKVVLDRTKIKDIHSIIKKLEEQRDRFRFLSERLAGVSADSAELYVELEEKNTMLSSVTARSAELVAELELKKEALQEANRELANANAHASELMADIELKNIEIEKLNGALADANANAAEILAELDESRQELQKTKALVRKEGSRLKTYLNVASVMFIVIGNDMRIKLINPKGCEVLGYSENELIGKNWFEIAIPDSDRDYIKSVFNRIVSGELEGLEYVEADILNRNGERRTIAWRNSYIKNDEGEIVSTVSSGADITEKKNLSEKLEKRELQFRLLTENQGDVVFSIDKSGVLRYLSPAVYDFGGYDPEEEIGEHVIKYLDDSEDFIKIIPMIENMIKNRSTECIELMYKPKSGEPFPVEITGRATFIDGKFDSIQCVMRDIRVRKWNENNLQFQRDVAQYLISESDLEMGIFNLKNMISDFIDVTHLEILPSTVAQEEKSNTTDPERSIWNGKLDDSERRTIAQFLLAGETFSGDLRFKNEDGKNSLLYSIPINPGVEDVGAILLEIAPGKVPRKDMITTLERIGFNIGEFIQRMDVERKERESRERLEMSLEGGHLGIWDMDLENNKMFHNERWMSYLGYDHDEIGGTFESWEELIHPNDRDITSEMLQDHIDGKSDVYENELRIKVSNGDWKWIYQRGRITETNDDGVPTRITGTHQDITSRKAAEIELVESEERFRNIFERSNLGIYRTSPGGKVLLANEALAHILGYNDVDDLMKRDISKEGYHDPEERNSFMRRIERDGVIQGSEILWRKKNGDMIFVNETARCVRDEEGNTLFYEGTVEDVTERKQAQEALLQSQRQLETILENVQSGIMIIDAEDHTILDANPKALEIYDLKKESVINRSYDEIFCGSQEGKCPLTKIGSGNKNDEAEFITEKGRKISILKTESEVEIQGRRMLIESFVDVTEQRRMREELKEEKEKFESISSSAQDAIVMIDNLGKITFWNEAAERIFGYGRDDMMGCNFHKIITPDYYHSKHFPAFDHFRKTGKGNAIGKTLELIGLNRDRQEIPVELSLSAVRIKGKWNAIGIMRDISERKEVEKRIKESEDRLSTFLKSATDAFMLLDGGLNLLIANDLGYERFNVEPGEAIGKHITELVPLDRNMDRYKAFEKVLSTGDPYFENELIPRWEPGLQQFSLKAFKAGKGLGLIISNITPIKEAKHEIDKQKAYLEELFESSPEAICVLDQDDRVSRINRGFTDLFGYLPHEAEGRKIVDLVVPDGDRKYSLVLTNSVAEGQTVYKETVRKRKDGTMVEVSILGTPINIGQKLEAVYAIYRDISTQKNAEREMKEARRKAEEATRMKSEFLANMSHEIRTPMNAILGFSEILDKKIEDRALKGYLGAISSSGKTLLRLINDILDLSKIEAGKIELSYKPIEIEKIMDDMRRIFQMKIKEKGLQMNLDVESVSHRDLVLDEVRIRQILMNLIGNAIKFTEEGSITLGCSTSPGKDENHVDLQIRVEDTGIGIPEEERDRIFGMFDQMKGQDAGKYGGTGLGLAISRKLVNLMDGTIELESEVGKGSIFRIKLGNVRVMESGRDTEKRRSDDPSRISFKGSNILVADDVEYNINLIRGFLEDRNLNVISASNGKEVIELLDNNRIDLILMDLKMPVMNGFEAVDHIRNQQKNSGIKIVALTASIVRSEKNDLTSKGFDSSLLKPFSYNELIMTLSEYLPHDLLKGEIDSVKIAPSTDSELSKLGIRDARNLLDIMIVQLGEPLQKALETSSIDSMVTVSEKLIEIGKDTGYRDILRMGEELKQSVDRFDIDGMTRNLRSVESLITGIRKGIETGGVRT
jgi:PAS domain S-box-containing protein